MSPILIASLIVAVGTWLVLRFASKRSEEKKRAGRVAHRQALGLSPEIPEARPRVDVKVEIEIDDDPEEFSIAGINFRGLTDDLLGDFDGYLVSDTKNTHDKNAVGVLTEDRVLLGYIPREYNEAVRARLDARGGIVPASGYVAKGRDEIRSFYYGAVSPKWGETVQNRAKIK